MRICDICKVNPAKDEQDFHREMGEYVFQVRCWVTNKSGGEHLYADICPDCAAKAVLSVMGVESQEVKNP